jgi:hypothetical protein
MFTRRNKRFIDFEVQSNLVIRLCCHWMVYVLAVSIAMLFWLRLVEGVTDSWSATFERFWFAIAPVLLVSLCLLPAFILDAVKLSNRFSGPIFRLRRALASLAKGQSIRPLEFRTNDFWRSLANDFNQVVPLTPQATTDSPSKQPE